LLRCKYYHLEDRKAPIRDFAANHAAITKCTKELQDLYIKRKHIELHQRLPDVRHMMSDEDQALVRALKYERKTIVDKMGKLTKKIDTYLSKPNGVQLRPKWENELEYAQLKLLELDRKIDGINGLA
jgi:GTP-binding protein EngB required for normal cell division